MSDNLRVLFVAVDRLDEQGRSRPDAGVQSLIDAIRQAGLFQTLELRYELTSRSNELQWELRRFRPHVVHFASDHVPFGEFQVARRRGPQTVGARTLGELIATLSETARVVVLSMPGVSSRTALLERAVEFTVVTNRAVGDPATAAFAESFYRALASGHTVDHAFRLASERVRLERGGEPEVAMRLARTGMPDSALIAPPPRAEERLSRPDFRRRLIGAGWTRGGGALLDPRTPPEDLPAECRVWFATNRSAVIKEGRVRGFGARSRRRISYGFCDVVVPRSHVIGSLGSPWWKRLLRWEDDRLHVTEMQCVEESRFWALIRDGVAAVAHDQRAALVFLHGYNVSFRNAALRTAQLGFDLKVQGPVAFFSWPSLGRLRDYFRDGSAIESSETAIAAFLADFARRTGVERVNVIAHSMGNRGLLRALQRIVARAEDLASARFGHLVLAAPDITRELFLDLAELYTSVGERTTLYVSDRDRALRTSRLLQGDRVGFAPPVTVCPGIDTVYVADVDDSFMGHSPFAESRPVLSDIHQLLAFDAPPEKRIGLDEAFSADGRYWLIRK